MPVETLIEYLDENDVEYRIIEHDKAYTAQEAAAAAHVSGKRVAKAVMLKLDEEMAMAVLPASAKVNVARIQEYTGAESARLATEAEFKDLFPDCELGALPPFGNLYQLRVFAEEGLSRQMEIAFCGGSHRELVQISFSDFERLAEPEMLSFAYLEK